MYPVYSAWEETKLEATDAWVGLRQVFEMTKTTKKIVLRLQCQSCKHVSQHAIKKCKHFLIGWDKKGKGTSLF
ncbi:hypothetical protein IFM89_015926 [Coptis chinensis]|uniref:60S ribosomal protein L44 n=1 Tax=Coptis chinensis TaxID=261450 RepID=A0A835HSW4_9MAGN|nr:hypothetical protein IFM89_015926 [Coptis chinensis]